MSKTPSETKKQTGKTAAPRGNRRFAPALEVLGERLAPATLTNGVREWAEYEVRFADREADWFGRHDEEDGRL